MMTRRRTRRWKRAPRRTLRLVAGNAESGDKAPLALKARIKTRRRHATTRITATGASDARPLIYRRRPVLFRPTILEFSGPPLLAGPLGCSCVSKRAFLARDVLHFSRLEGGRHADAEV